MSSRPNILIFCTDQQRADQLGCVTPQLKTPHLDTLAARGQRFTSAYAATPACMPARAAMFTGHTIRGTGMRQHGVPLPEDIPTLPGMLGNAGYRTHSVGKLHLKPWASPPGTDFSHVEAPGDNPERRQHWDDGHWRRSPSNYYGLQTQDMVLGHGLHTCEGGDYAAWLKQHAPEEIPRYAENGWDSIDVKPEHHYNHWIADRSVDFIERHAQTEADRPFFLWCSFPDPHTPFAACRKYAEQYDVEDMPLGPAVGEVPNAGTSQTLAAIEPSRMPGVQPRDPEQMRQWTRQMFGMMTHIDQQIGRVLACLGEQGLTDNTVVVFISDHGEQMGEHGVMFKGLFPYDGSARIPWIVHVPWADPQHAGRTVDTPISQIDLVPTMLDLAGVPQPTDPRLTPEILEQFPNPPDPLPGESLKPVLLDGADPQRGCALIEFNNNDLPEYENLMVRTLVTPDFKLAFFSPTREVLLFDRRSDPHEMNNLAKDPEYAGVVADMLARMLDETQRTEPIPPRFFNC
ncbi:MAG: sulfatase-like hydrolase/transferase [Planctomycetota bacterium]